MELKLTSISLTITLVNFSAGLSVKSGNINNSRTGLSDISYKSPFSRDSDNIEKLPKEMLKNRF